jgi:ankyrin repeat protein
VNSLSEVGFTPLHSAAGYGKSKDTICTLINLGTDIEASTPDGRRPLHMACFKSQLDCVQELLRLGADIESQDDNAWTPLHFASRYGHLDVVKLLLKPDAGKKAVPVGKRTTGGQGWNMEDCTAADLAKANGHESVLQILVEAGYIVSEKENETEDKDETL